MATTIPRQSTERLLDVHFPRAGVDVSQAFCKQPPRQVEQGVYSRSTPVGQNVRGFEPLTLRARGGNRAGLVRYIPTPLVAGWIVQELNYIVIDEKSMITQNQAGRDVILVAVSQGNVFIARSGDTSWTSTNNTTGNSPPLNFTGILYSSANIQKLWFADGVHWCYYDPTNNSVNTWAASAGTLPVDSQGNLPRLITTWRGRTVLSGLILDPQDWFMSAVGDPTNFDYFPALPSPAQAVAGINAPQGFVGDVVTTLIPYNDDVLIFGGDHTIYLMSGDPMAGGQIDLVSNSIGMAWGIPWCMDPYGNIYFISNRTGIYSLVPGQQPVRISQQIEKLLLDVDTGTNTFRLMWDDRFQGLHVFASPTVAPGNPGTVTHFFFELRSGAWWTDQFSNPNMDPLTCVVFDGNTPGDRVPLIGSWDGYVRAINPTALTDDGQPISSAVILGPLLSPDQDDMLLKDLQCVLGESSNSVTFGIYLGPTPEAALASSPVLTGTWNASRNPTSYVRRAGHAVYVKITSTSPWEMEQIRFRFDTQGKVRQRSKF